jgi:hypothetical protein
MHFSGGALLGKIGTKWMLIGLDPVYIPTNLLAELTFVPEIGEERGKTV